MQEQKRKSATKEMCVDEIKKIAKKLNQETISHKDFNDNSIYSSSVVVKRFGSWHLALKAAGILSSQNRKITENDLFENILTVWTHYGRQPKSSEMNIKPSIISNATYIDKFGGWIKALNAFEVFANNNQTEEEEESNKIIEDNLKQFDKGISEIKIKDEDKHKISLGLRYKVFSRDRFRCVKCGRSPATELINITLHADHILPFSKGGRTIFDNLQTTCSDCNLGKGNRYTE
jgi:5-methylcytosine-specific restriction endonuclease McrA